MALYINTALRMHAPGKMTKNPDVLKHRTKNYTWGKNIKSYILLRNRCVFTIIIVNDTDWLVVTFHHLAGGFIKLTIHHCCC